MSILIKGMEMPERCWDCDLCYDKFYCKSLEILLLGEQDKKFRPEDFYPADDRLPNCPLVPVPPHGRLGNLDALAVHKFAGAEHDISIADGGACYRRGWNDAIEAIIENAETIIGEE